MGFRHSSRNNKIAWIIVGLLFTIATINISKDVEKKEAEEAKQAKTEIHTDSEPDKSKAYIISQNFVEDRLKSPSTAHFPIFDYSCKQLEDHTFLVRSYVDAQNAFGATIRTDY